MARWVSGQVGPAARALLATTGVASAGMSLSGVFVSLFLLTSGNSPIPVALQELGGFVGIAAASWAAMGLGRTGPKALFRLGLGLTALFYIGLLVLGRGAAQVAIALGLVYGGAAGAYWLGVNALIYDATTAAERSPYYGISGAVGGVAGVVMPAVGGAVIAAVAGVGGYIAVFLGAVGLFAASGALAGRLPEGAPVGGLDPRRALGLVALRGRWRSVWRATAAVAVRDAVLPVVSVVLVYRLTRDAGDVGLFAAVTALSASAASWAARHLTVRQRWAPWLGGVGLAAAPILLLLPPSFAWVVAYGVVGSVFYPALNVPMSAVTLDVMDEDPAARRDRGAYILSMELALATGRVVALLAMWLALMLWPARPVLVAAALFAGAAALASAAALSRLAGAGPAPWAAGAVGGMEGASDGGGASL